MNKLRKLLLSILMVPAEPQPPPGSTESLRIFRAAPAYYHYSILKWGLAQLGALFGLAFSLFVTFGFLERWIPDFLGVLEILAIPIFLIQAIVSFVLLRLHYELRWYMVSDRSLRIREGIFRIREQTMTVANIQNIGFRQGPLQRAFGIADLEVRTAGGGTAEGQSEGGGANDPHLGSLRGLADAKEVRNLIYSALRRQRGSGLGDPDETSPTLGTNATPTSDRPRTSLPLEAAKAVLRETRALRKQLTAVSG